MNHNILGVDLRMTCGACPEQYNAYIGDKQVGYFRLRHGSFRVDYPECGGETVFYSSNVKGDGVFEDDEREYFLTKGVIAILDIIKEEEQLEKI